jgi:molecular chaperone HtpG
MTSGIVFQVETGRILQILAKEIYDSPLALLRENVQNAYDAIRERFVAAGTLQDGGRIDVRVANGEVSIVDNGVGMSEEVLRKNFWKAGSSGKHSEAARRAGVVGTFGIGAMANFGVCSRLRVETRALGTDITLRSAAERETLRIGEECILLEQSATQREVGTTVTATLDSQLQLTSQQAKSYLEPYVSFLPVPVFVNNELISQRPYASRPPFLGRVFTPLLTVEGSDPLVRATFHIEADANWQLRVRIDDISLAGNAISGEVEVVQAGGQLMGFRSYFGLAPVPVATIYQFGGVANLGFLQPTAGRDALARESIDQTQRLLTLADRLASEALSSSPGADRNNAFLQWALNNGRYDLARRVTVQMMPEDAAVELGDVPTRVAAKNAHYYLGTDAKIIATFASDQTHLFQVAQMNPRRAVQLHYLQSILKVPQVPDSPQVIKIYKGSELSTPEASTLLRIAAILREDYSVADVNIVLAEISHGVTVFPNKTNSELQVYIARSSALLPPLYEFYQNAYELFTQFMKDFVRAHIYPRIQEHVPSSTRLGVDALRKVLERNRELYKYEESERGDLEGVLGEYLSGSASFSEILRTATSRVQGQTQRVTVDQIGSVESVVPGVVQSPVAIQDPADVSGFQALPPIIRDEVSSPMKILTTDQTYPQLNNFRALLGLSDRVMRMEADFFRIPHTTRVLWGGHRVIYIFTEATGRLSLYYDIELRSPIEHDKAAGGMIPTTTLITKNRIFVPVPNELIEEFTIAAGTKEFFVRFDILSTPRDG